MPFKKPVNWADKAHKSRRSHITQPSVVNNNINYCNLFLSSPPFSPFSIPHYLSLPLRRAFRIDINCEFGRELKSDVDGKVSTSSLAHERTPNSDEAQKKTTTENSIKLIGFAGGVWLCDERLKPHEICSECKNVVISFQRVYSFRLIVFIAFALQILGIVSKCARARVCACVCLYMLALFACWWRDDRYQFAQTEVGQLCGWTFLLSWICNKISFCCSFVIWRTTFTAYNSRCIFIRKCASIFLFEFNFSTLLSPFWFQLYTSFAIFSLAHHIWEPHSAHYSAIYHFRTIACVLCICTRRRSID